VGRGHRGATAWRRCRAAALPAVSGVGRGGPVRELVTNEGWGKAEFDSIYTREILEKKNVMLPVWHGVQVAEVYAYSPRLVDKVGLDSSLGVKELARRLATAIKETNA